MRKRTLLVGLLFLTWIGASVAVGGSLLHSAEQRHREFVTHLRQSEPLEADARARKRQKQESLVDQRLCGLLLCSTGAVSALLLLIASLRRLRPRRTLWIVAACGLGAAGFCALSAARFSAEEASWRELAQELGTHLEELALRDYSQLGEVRAEVIHERDALAFAQDAAAAARLGRIQAAGWLGGTLLLLLLLSLRRRPASEPLPLREMEPGPRWLSGQAAWLGAALLFLRYAQHFAKQGAVNTRLPLLVAAVSLTWLGILLVGRAPAAPERSPS